MYSQRCLINMFPTGNVDTQRGKVMSNRFVRDGDKHPVFLMKVNIYDTDILQFCFVYLYAISPLKVCPI